ncbi:MAG: SDR family NAD(P)-dependent oxidoreductase, partial [Chloroflexi bacterium]
DPYIRYRDGKRWVREWQEPAQRTASARLPWRDGGCYLITGGAGGLAQLFVQEIAQHVESATVILVGRSALSSEKYAQLEQLGRGHVHVNYQQLDVACMQDSSDRPTVHALIQRVLQKSGRLDGIIHAAGVSRNTRLLDKTQEEVQAVLAPKVIGVEQLDEASKHISLDFFIVCSSLSAVIGGVGYADYAGANAYLDAFAHTRRAKVLAGERQGATLSINWPYWETGGMQVDASMLEMMRELLGQEPMGTETGMRTLYQALSCGQAQVMVLHGQVERIKQHFRLFSFPRSLGGYHTSHEGESGKLQSFDAVSTHKLCEALTHMVSRMLKVQVEQIDHKTNFSEYGFDSINFIQFANRLNQTYQLNLTPPLLFEHSTIERLVQYLQVTYASVLAPHFATVSPVDSGNHTPEMVRKDTASEPVTTEGASFPNSIARSHFSDVRSLVQISEQKAFAPASPIAIIGMSGMFPLAPDVQSLWSNLLVGRDCTGEIPASRWDWQSYFGDPGSSANKANVKRAGITDGIEQFDPLFFGISPREAEQMDPQQRLLMMYVWKAIEDAGYAASSLSGTDTALFVGTISSGYCERLSQARVPIESYSSTGQTPSVGPNRMSYFLNLHGPSQPIETACSSSLIAIHRGVNAIESGQCAMAIVGGINILVSPAIHISFNKAGLLSEDGRCKPFSAQADGYGRGEGVGMLVLKKLSDAEQAGDHIYGVIRGSAENHGGRASSLTAPNPRAQADLLIAAYRKAGIDPRTVSYIEAHGTGTPLGDPIEINGLKTAWNELSQMIGEGPMLQTVCGIGSVKSNIGHLELASGVTGVIKVLLQMQHKQLVKSLHCEQINPYIQLEGSPFYIVQENREWEALRDYAGNALPRRAGVSSFGAGGSNAHVVLEEYVPKTRESRPISTMRSGSMRQAPGRGKALSLVVLSARNEERLREQVRQLLAWIQAKTSAEEPLQDLAYTLQVGREAMEERLALQVSSLAELEEKLGKYLQEPQEEGDWYRGQVRSHKETMALFNTDEELQEVIDKWLQHGRYEKILQWWVKGLKIEWQRLYTIGAGLEPRTTIGVSVRHDPYSPQPMATAPALPQRISLPTYPFARERYWLLTPKIEPISGSTVISLTVTSPANTASPLSSTEHVLLDKIENIETIPCTRSASTNRV